MRRFLALALAAGLLLSVAIPVSAVKPVPVTATIALATADPHFGGIVTFTATAPRRIKVPRVEVLCFQSGTLVYGETGSLAQALGDGTDPLGYSGFLLGGAGSIWVYQFPNTPASCVANLFYFDNSGPAQLFVVLASTSFEAAG